MHATYCKVLKLSLGLDAIRMDKFYSTITRMYPVVKEMVDEMCEEAKQEMKTMDEHTLGSWKQAVTSADAAWMTRGYHSKNGTARSVFVTTIMEHCCITNTCVNVVGTI